VKTGLYSDTLKNVWGCDSVCRLWLEVHPAFLHFDTIEICGQEQGRWRGQDYRVPGWYSDSMKTVYGCDSVYRMLLQVHPTYEFLDTATICSHESYMWRGRRLTNANDYWEWLRTSFGCDSVYRLHLIVNPSYKNYDTVDVCGSYYAWRGRMLVSTGDYYDSLQTMDNCPEVYHLCLRLHFSYLQEDTVEICSDLLPYVWHGKELKSSGVYNDSLKTQAGCDSVFRLTLKVNPVYLFPEKQEICKGGVYVWHGRNLQTEGVYFDSLKTKAGCDSVYQLTLKVNSTFLDADTVKICADLLPYVWHGRNLQTEGVYYDSLNTKAGCDSVYQLTLKVNPVYFFSEKQEICKGGTYAWHGRNLQTDGIYFDSLKTAAGCDSVYQLALKVHPTYHYADTVDICAGSSYMWHGKKLKKEGVYVDSLKSVSGCDSVFSLCLHVHSIQKEQLYAEICPGSAYVWHGRELTQQGLYFDTLKSQYGCDSIVQLYLITYPVFLQSDTVDICKGAVYVWRGRNLQTEGVYTDSLKNVYGCDSVYQLTLKVNPVYFFAEKQEICKGGAYAWHGRKLQAEGVYYDSLKTKSGCDSVYQLTLMVYPTFVEADTVVICADLLPYVWHGRNLLVEGDYADSLHTSHGCDSVCALRLIVNPVFVTAISDTICEGVPYNRYGFVLPSDSTVGTSQLTLTDSLRSVEGCDSVVTLSLHIRILPKEMSMIYGDTLVSKAGTYMYYTDTLAGIDRYEWQVIPQSIAITPSESKVWLDFDRSSAGWDTLVLIGHHVCGQTAPRMFPIHVIIGDDVTKVSLQEGVSIYPNPAQSEVCIELQSFESWDKPRWMLCDMQGRVLDGGSIEGMQTRIRLDDYPRGVYVVRLLSAGSRQCSLKVVKY
jgi:hypothetical protein